SRFGSFRFKISFVPTLIILGSNMLDLSRAGPLAKDVSLSVQVPASPPCVYPLTKNIGRWRSIRRRDICAQRTSAWLTKVFPTIWAGITKNLFGDGESAGYSRAVRNFRDRI